MTKEFVAVLDALCDMYNQYCGQPAGHCFMSAGENADDVLSKYGLIKNDKGNGGEIDFEKLEELKRTASEDAERPKITDYFPDMAAAHDEYTKSPSLFKYVQALDNYTDELEQSESRLKGSTITAFLGSEAAQEAKLLIESKETGTGNSVLARIDDFLQSDIAGEPQKLGPEDFIKEKLSLLGTDMDKLERIKYPMSAQTIMDFVREYASQSESELIRLKEDNERLKEENERLQTILREIAETNEDLTKMVENLKKSSIKYQEEILQFQSRIQQLEQSNVPRWVKAEEILKELCQLKHYKDTVGKDAFYEKTQPELWKKANEFLNSLVKTDQ